MPDAARACGWLQKKPQTCAPCSCNPPPERGRDADLVDRLASTPHLGKLALRPALLACLDGLLDQHHVEYLGYRCPSGLHVQRVATRGDATNARLLRARGTFGVW